MKDDSQHTPITRELEARIVALVLGEVADFERDELLRLIEQRPELAAFQAEMQDVHGLLAEVGQDDAPPDENWRLPKKQRSSVLSTISGQTSDVSNLKITDSRRQTKSLLKRRYRLIAGIAASLLVMFAGLAWILNGSHRNYREVATRIQSPKGWAASVEKHDRYFKGVFESEESAPAELSESARAGSERNWEQAPSSLAKIREHLSDNIIPSYVENDYYGRRHSGSPGSGMPDPVPPPQDNATWRFDKDIGDSARSQHFDRADDEATTTNMDTYGKAMSGMADASGNERFGGAGGGGFGGGMIPSTNQPQTTFDWKNEQFNLETEQRPGTGSNSISSGSTVGGQGFSGDAGRAQLKNGRARSKSPQAVRDMLDLLESKESNEDAAEITADDLDSEFEKAQVEFVPELGQIIIKGNLQSIDRVRGVIADTEASKESTKPGPSDNPFGDSEPIPSGQPMGDPFGAPANPATSPTSDPFSDPFGGGSNADADPFHDGADDPFADAPAKREAKKLKRELQEARQRASSEEPNARVAKFFDEAPQGIVRGEPKASGFIVADKFIASATQKPTPSGLNEKLAEQEAFSTFSLHVSDVSFKLARAALAKGQWPEAAKIRIEEFVNALDYGDPMPCGEERVACQVEQAAHPFLQQRNVLRVSMRTAAAGRASTTPLRLTFLLDNSGSMERIDRRQTVRRAFALLAQQLKPIDQVTLIAFARQPRLLADKVNGAKCKQLVQLIDRLPSEGGTNIEAALNLAFEKAREHKLENAQNRIILLTDGAVNLGNANPETLAQTVTTMRRSGIAFDAAGISADGLNDEVLEALTRQGDGRYYLLDSLESANDGFAQQIAGALRPSAKNVKVQVEFNPRRVGRYKLLGFEKHRLKKEDFRDDKVDAAEMAAAEAGVALYQVEAKPDGEGDIGSVSVRFRDLSTGRMVEHRWPIPYEAGASRLGNATPSLRIATSAAFLAAKLRGEALGEVVDLRTLADFITQLPQQDRVAPRVHQLQQMIQQARQINGK